MQVTLNQKEIETAIITFVGNQGISTVGKRTEVTLIAGRAPNGMSASIEISDDVNHNPPSTGVPRKSSTCDSTLGGCGVPTTLVNITEESETNVDEPEEIIAAKPLFGN